jgi:hypothetical protein
MAYYNQRLVHYAYLYGQGGAGAPLTFQLYILRQVCLDTGLCSSGLSAHVILCWLALLLARITENACGTTWPNIRRELDRIAIGTFTGPAGTFRQRTEITKPQRDILAKLSIDPPPRIYQLTPAKIP